MMGQKFLRGLTIVVMAYAATGCAYFGQFTTVEPDVVYVPGESVHVASPTLGQVLGQSLLSTEGPTVYWHPRSGEHEYAPNVFDLEYMRQTNGRYRNNIRMSIVPRGIVREITIVPINHSHRLRGPSERSGWSWTTPNHYDGAWRGYKLQIHYRNGESSLEYEYWVLSSPNRHVPSP